MEIWQGLVGLGFGLLSALITWFFTSVNKDKEKGVRLAFDSEKTAESLKKVEQNIEKLESTNNIHSRILNGLEENYALFEQREQNMVKTLDRIENTVNGVLSEFVRSNNNLANAINLQSEYLKQHTIKSKNER